MTAPFGIRAALEHRNVEPGQGTIWGAIQIEARGPALETERAPLAVALVVDVSGSMAGEPLAHALRSCEIVSELLSPGDRLAIVTFSTKGSILCDLTALDAAGRTQIRASVREVRARANTNLQDGLAVAAAVLRQAPPGLRRVMAVLSDGKPNRGSSSPTALANYVRGLGVAVSSLGFGPSYDEDVLDAIATAGSGRYTPVRDPAVARVDLARAVSAQGGIVADHLALTLEPATGVEVVQLLPSSQLRFGRGGVMMPVGDVFKDEARTFAVELQLDLGHHASGRLLEVVVEGNSPDGVAHRVSATLEVDVRAGSRIADPGVQREVLVLQADAARAHARSHADRRSTPTAIAVLRETIARIDALEGFALDDGSHLAELREQMLDEATGYARRATSLERSHRRKSAVAYKPNTPGFLRPRRERPALAARLIGADGPIRDRAFELWTENIVGRSTLCDIAIRDAGLSRNHARIQFIDDHYRLIDLGSAHGTSVNGRPIQSARLAHGDQVQLGEAIFRFEVTSPRPLELPEVDAQNVRFPFPG
jgi:Mg-chelatase subunit ChlD